MNRQMLRSKIHRIAVTECDVEYEGSLTLDPVIMREAGMVPFERIDVYDVDNAIEYVEAVRNIVDDATSVQDVLPGGDAPHNVFAYDYSIVALNDQYLNIRSRTFLTVTYACVAVFLVLCVFLRDPVAALVCVFYVFVIETDAGTIDAQLDTQLEIFEKALKDAG